MSRCKTCDKQKRLAQELYQRSGKEPKMFTSSGYSRLASFSTSRIPKMGPPRRALIVKEPSEEQVAEPVINQTQTDEEQPGQYYYEDITTQSSNPTDVYNSLTTDVDRIGYLNSFVNPESGQTEGWKRSAAYLGIQPTEGMLKLIDSWKTSGRGVQSPTKEYPQSVNMATTRVWYDPNKRRISADTLTAEQKNSAVALKSGGTINYFKFFK